MVTSEVARLIPTRWVPQILNGKFHATLWHNFCYKVTKYLVQPISKFQTTTPHPPHNNRPKRLLLKGISAHVNIYICNKWFIRAFFSLELEEKISLLWTLSVLLETLIWLSSSEMCRSWKSRNFFCLHPIPFLSEFLELHVYKST